MVIGAQALGACALGALAIGALAFPASSDADYIIGTTVFVDGGLLWNYHEP